MRASTVSPTHLPTRSSLPRPNRAHGRRIPAATAWQGPTLGEFVARVESEFGAQPLDHAADELVGGRARGASSLTGLTPGERLSPGALRELCRSWGLPAEDFGVDAD